MWAYLLPALLCLLAMSKCLEHDSLDCHLQTMPGSCCNMKGAAVDPTTMHSGIADRVVELWCKHKVRKTS
jgi:hypothetical protein